MISADRVLFHISWRCIVSKKERYRGGRGGRGRRRVSFVWTRSTTSFLPPSLKKLHHQYRGVEEVLEQQLRVAAIQEAQVGLKIEAKANWSEYHVGSQGAPHGPRGSQTRRAT